MKGKLVLKIFSGILVLAAIILLLIAPLILEPLVKKKIQIALNEKYKDYDLKIDKVRISLISSTIELENITLQSKSKQGNSQDLKGEIESVKVKGIKFLKALLLKNYDITEIIISNTSLKGMVPFPKEEKIPVIARNRISIGKVLFDKVNIALTDSSSSKTFSVKEGVLKVSDIRIEKQDTLHGFLRNFDFQAEELISVSEDSLYTFISSGITYSDSIKSLKLDRFSIRPNYEDYDFTSLHQYQTDRIEAVLGNITMHNFPAEEYFNSGHLISSYIEIGKLELLVFRDKRKESSHKVKPAFQDMMYNYPGKLRIDSICLTSADITYKEHVEKANEPGWVSFNELNANIYNITNDTVYKTEDASFKLVAQALLMGKGRIDVVFNAKLFDNQNAFSMNGTLSELEVKELNPMLEKNIFVYATSGKIETIKFEFTANNTKATGQMTMLYHGLDLTVKNKRSDDTTAIKEQIFSLIANKKTLSSNPLPGEDVRIGIIEYERDPEKFIINYCIKSILSGIKSSVLKNQRDKKEKKTFLQKIFGKADAKKKKSNP